MMAAPAYKYSPPIPVRVEDYLSMEEKSETKHEFVNGKVVAMAGATEEHNLIVSNVIREVGSFLKGKDCHIYPSDLRVTTPSGKSYFYPDATVICGNSEKKEGVFDTLMNPTVIFEVISESTKDIDRGYKFFHYQQIPSLIEYVMIDSREYAIEIIKRQPDGAWKFDKYFPADKQIQLNSINCSLLFNDVYYRVNLPVKE